MKLYLGFDDTDMRDAPVGTGKLVRMYEKKLPPEVRFWGVVRHQLLVDERIAYTSHNGAICAVLELENASLVPKLTELAEELIVELASPGSNPGLCVAIEHAGLNSVIEFGLACTQNVCSQAGAMAAAMQAQIHLSGHGGTNAGIIGATAAVGLTLYGWSGRFLEFNKLSKLPDPVRVEQLLERDILPVAVDGDAAALAPETLITTAGWASPRLWAGKAILPVKLHDGEWVSLGKHFRATGEVE